LLIAEDIAVVSIDENTACPLYCIHIGYVYNSALRQLPHKMTEKSYRLTETVE